jgi:hypothetical protein
MGQSLRLLRGCVAVGALHGHNMAGAYPSENVDPTLTKAQSPVVCLI